MGEVYRGHDLRMRRDVAIKISAEGFSDQRSREVHTVAALNHPDIGSIYVRPKAISNFRGIRQPPGAILLPDLWQGWHWQQEG
jgi:serine/threonine protein kinase